MLRLILALAALCVGSGALGLGHVTPVSGRVSGLCLAVLAVSATLLLGSCEAYETQAVRRDRDDG